MMSSSLSSSSSSSSSSVPVGHKFKPTHKELVCHYLWRKVHGHALSCTVVMELDVYAREPWLLEWKKSRGMSYEDRCYFVKREKKTKNCGNGKRPNRTVKGDINGGWWKANTGDKEILDNRGCVVGCMKSLTFFSYKNSKRIRKEATKSDWIMHEYRLEPDNLEEWVLCRIRYTGKEIMEEEDDYEIHEEMRNEDAKIQMNISMPLINQEVDIIDRNSAGMLENTFMWSFPSTNLNDRREECLGADGCCFNNIQYSENDAYTYVAALEDKLWSVPASDHMKGTEELQWTAASTDELLPPLPQMLEIDPNTNLEMNGSEELGGDCFVNAQTQWLASIDKLLPPLP